MIDLNSAQIEALFENFSQKKIAVLGDVMVDAYIRGGVNRISPEAPVPIINFEKNEERLGGAANVALNLVALGAKAIICSVIGSDESGDKLKELLLESGISNAGIVQSSTRKTTVKTRVIGNNQQLIRIDAEQTNDISQSEENQLIQSVKQLVESGIDALIFEDYNKGVLTERVIQEVIHLCQQNGVKTTVDPKKKNFLAYKEVTLFKPNLKELKEGLELSFQFEERNQFLAAVALLNQKLNNEITFVTLSEHGVFIQDDEIKHFIPAHLRNIADVSGAGDTVISVATLCLISGLSIHNLAAIANLAGGLVCEQSGVVSVDKLILKSEILDLHQNGKA
jgi:rfaE bifunctional protein kinase chain/domain